MESGDEGDIELGPTRVVIEAENSDLLLPSSAPAIEGNLASHSLLNKEKRLRRAQLESQL